MSGTGGEDQAREVRLAPESIEALAVRLAELIGGPQMPEPAAPPARLLSAAEVARWWGVERSWVYAHATELGARRLGSGARPRLRFEPDEVAEALGAPTPGHRGPVDGGRSAPLGADSLSGPGGAMVADRAKDGRGGAQTPPGPAPKEKLRRTQKPSPAGRLRHLLAAGRRGGGR